MVGREGLCIQTPESPKKKVVGEPYEGKPHVRFEVAGDGNQDMVVALRHSQEETESNELLYLSPRRHSLTLPADRASPDGIKGELDGSRGFQG